MPTRSAAKRSGSTIASRTGRNSRATTRPTSATANGIRYRCIRPISAASSSREPTSASARRRKLPNAKPTRCCKRFSMHALFRRACLRSTAKRSIATPPAKQLYGDREEVEDFYVDKHDRESIGPHAFWRTGRIDDFRVRMHAADGGIFWGSISGAPDRLPRKPGHRLQHLEHQRPDHRPGADPASQ